MRRGHILLVSLRASLAALLVACAPTLSLGTPCELSSDCPEPFVCRYQRCRVACREARDCGPGLRCVVGGEGVEVCTLEREETCGGASPCPTGLRCVDGECRTECGGVAVCTSAGVCVDGTCVEPSSGQDAGPPSDAPACAPSDSLVCADGLVQRCDLDFGGVAAVLTGGTTGEAAPHGTHTLGPTPWPHDGDPLVPGRPEVAVALSRSGLGVVLSIAGESRELSAYQFSHHDLALGAAVVIERPGLGPPEPPITSALSVGLAENGDEITGFVLDLTPATAGALVGHRLTFRADGSGAEQPLGAGDPPATTGGRVAVLGGERAIVGTDAPIFYLTRELVQPGSVPVLGAADETISMATYRSTLTASLGAAPFLESAGSAGALALFRADGPEIGLWDVPDTAPLMGGTRTDDLAVHDVGAQGEPSIAALGDVDYLLAVPVEVAGVGYVRFFDLVCPTVGPCNAPVQRGADLQARSGRVPLAVRLLAMPGGGWAMPSLETGPDGERLVFVRILDPNLSPIASEPGPLVTSAGGGEDIVAIDAAATRTGATVTLVVAALIRNTTRREDRVVLAGLDACIER